MCQKSNLVWAKFCSSQLVLLFAKGAVFTKSKDQRLLFSSHFGCDQKHFWHCWYTLLEYFRTLWTTEEQCTVEYFSHVDRTKQVRQPVSLFTQTFLSLVDLDNPQESGLSYLVCLCLIFMSLSFCRLDILFCENANSENGQQRNRTNGSQFSSLLTKLHPFVNPACTIKKLNIFYQVLFSVNLFFAEAATTGAITGTKSELPPHSGRKRNKLAVQDVGRLSYNGPK